VIYSAIGRAVVKYGWRFARRRYGRPLRIGAGLAAAGLGAALYLANRHVPEG
jgi:hypothetical protein